MFAIYYPDLGQVSFAGLDMYAKRQKNYGKFCFNIMAENYKMPVDANVFWKICSPSMDLV